MGNQDNLDNLGKLGIRGSLPRQLLPSVLKPIYERYRKLSKDDAEKLAKLGSAISRHSRSRTPTVGYGRVRSLADAYEPGEKNETAI